MKKIISLILLSVLLLSFAACGNKIEENKEPATQAETQSVAPTEEDLSKYDIEWQQIPDMDIVGAWQRADGEDDGYYIFTAEKTLRYMFGTSYFEAEITYGQDKVGNKSAYTEGSVLYGQWTYGFDGEYLTVTYPDGNQFVYVPVIYDPINLVADENFVKDDDLVGVWKSTDTEETYEFTEDGYAKYIGKYEDDVYKYEAIGDYTYTTDYYDVTITYYVNDTEKKTETFEYYANGDTLTLNDFTYTRVTE